MDKQLRGQIIAMSQTCLSDLDALYRLCKTTEVLWIENPADHGSESAKNCVLVARRLIQAILDETKEECHG